MAYILPESSAETKEDWRKILKECDTDDNGLICVNELADILPNFVGDLDDLGVTKNDLKQMVKYFDIDRNGKLTVDEIVENMHVIEAAVKNSAEIRQAFDVLDTNKDGTLRLLELKRILTFNNFMSGEEAGKLLTELLELFDTNKDYKFNYMEFVKMFSSGILDDAFNNKADRNDKEHQQQQED